ncbi:MAG TPA: carbohydrate-binding family 9-like protein [Thermoanaerobaculia bacterium]
MWSDHIAVPRAGFSIEEPWTAPPECEPVRLRNTVDGAAPRLATTVAVWFDEEMLTFLFSSTDDHIVARYTEHDAPLWEEDVVEVFLAPDGLTEYFELEVSPNGTTFDARIVSPDGARATMQTDLAWTCEGLMAAVRRATEATGEVTIDTVVRVPFRSLGRTAPVAGEEWRGNFFRIDRHEVHGDEYTAWRPTLRMPADFHVPGAFGRLVFA